jgi:hypothetical protein
MDNSLRSTLAVKVQQFLADSSVLEKVVSAWAIAKGV